MVLTYEDMVAMLEDEDQGDDDLNFEALRDVPLMQMSQKQRDAVFRNLGTRFDE